ncbi:hypothetical protein LZZ85_24355 [Terrimonas sp. NA20]|uniref:Uncharacterized protein n=1 Tax=Terrimonas ginsenosidimutans TaxID=2908004 RepID=A0ABS9KYR2_9BACT|nr:hypothetical protein [Terrimonas ginsenosidimutans]MCG2617453.1 hypothetical protein [Terrimonas ginsenosidimutans]
MPEKNTATISAVPKPPPLTKDQILMMQIANAARKNVTVIQESEEMVKGPVNDFVITMKAMGQELEGMKSPK